MKKFKFFEKLKAKILELKQKNKRVFFACIALLVIGIIVLVSIIFVPKKEKVDKSSASEFSISEYAANVENKLKEMILSLDAVSRVQVFVMLESLPQTKYLTEQSTETKTTEAGTNSTLSETVVFEKNGSVSTPVVVTVIMPKITGVLIVTNSVSTSTKLSIISSVGVVLNIDESRISLLQER